MLSGSAPNSARIFQSPEVTAWVALDSWRIADEGHGAESFERRVLAALRDTNWQALVHLLNLDFTVAAFVSRSNSLLLLRGPASRVPLYVRQGTSAPEICTRLWSGPDWGTIALPFLRQFLAGCYLPAPLECDHRLTTAAEGWLRVPRASVVEWRDGGLRIVSAIKLPALPTENRSIPAAEEALRAATDRRIANLCTESTATSDLSGGIDSGIISARAARLLGERYLGGVSLLTQYPELQREQEFVSAVCRHSNLSTAVLDVQAHLPFANLTTTPIHDEPSMSCLPWALFAASLGLARERGSRVHLHGIGGDQVFCALSPQFLTRFSLADGLNFIAWPARLDVRRHKAEMRRRYLDADPGCLSQGLLLYDGWIDRYVAPRIGVRHEGVFVDLHVLLSCLALRALNPYEADLPKMMPRRVFAADLPPEVLARRGKAGFDGVYQRGLRTHLAETTALIEGEAPLLAACGIKSKRLIAGLRQCAREGWGSAATPLFSALAWVTWAAGLRRAGVLRN